MTYNLNVLMAEHLNMLMVGRLKTKMDPRNKNGLYKY